MALQFFGIRRGLKLDGSVTIIRTSGPPASGDADVVEVGSVALDSVNGHLYQKNAAGTGLDKWQFIGADTNWRPEVVVRDNVSTTLPTETPGNPISVDGESITQDQRVLFSAISPGNQNVYIYDQVSGTFNEDTNEATSGDTVFVDQGTDAGKKYVYNGTAWVQNDQASADELAFIRAFIGKTAAGSETPDYTSENIVTDGDNLEVAIGKLDAAVGPSTQVKVSGSGTLTLDSVLVDDIGMLKWLVTARQGQLVYSEEVLATHDGDPSNDATVADYNRYGTVQLGSIAGLNIAVDVDGVGAAQEIRLRVTATGATDWTAHRIATVY